MLHEIYYFTKYETKIINYALALSGLRVFDNNFICVRKYQNFSQSSFNLYVSLNMAFSFFTLPWDKNASIVDLFVISISRTPFDLNFLSSELLWSPTILNSFWKYVQQMAWLQVTVSSFYMQHEVLGNIRWFIFSSA